jgi:hypothetical protein
MSFHEYVIADRDILPWDNYIARTLLASQVTNNFFFHDNGDFGIGDSLVG